MILSLKEIADLWLPYRIALIVDLSRYLGLIAINGCRNPCKSCLDTFSQRGCDEHIGCKRWVGLHSDPGNRGERGSNDEVKEGREGREGMTTVR